MVSGTDLAGQDIVPYGLSGQEGEATDLHNFGYVTPSGCRRFFRAASRTFWTEV
jgi:hypothetical protein